MKFQHIKFTQCERLWDWLVHRGPIDPMRAWTELGIYRLSGRIYDLKKQGQLISTRMITVKNKYGEKFRVAEYRREETNEC